MSQGLALSVQPAPDRRATSVGPRLEFLLVGGSTLLLLPLFVALRLVWGLDSSQEAVGFLAFHAAYLINDPHFSVTYLLFYKDAKRRALGDAYPRWLRWRYVLAGFVVPGLLVLWATWAITTRSAPAMGLMLQLMFFLVGWHYVKQGFGVLAVLSARAGVRYSARERALLLGHCFAAWIYARMSPFDPGTEYEEHGVVFRSLAHPAWAEPVTFVVFVLSALALVWALLKKQRTQGGLPWLPLLYFMVTVWLWVVYSSLDPLMVYMIPALHSVQYLYFVWLLKRNEARAEQGPPLFKRSVPTRLGILAASAVGLAWLLFHGAPETLDELSQAGAAGQDDLGSTPFVAAFVTIVNLHHYFMDNVIWRRENPETRFLRDDLTVPA